MRLASIKIGAILVVVVFFAAATITAAAQVFPSTSNSVSASLKGKTSEGKPAAGLSSLPTGAQGAIASALGKNDSGYWLHQSAGGFDGENSRQTFVATFTRAGVDVRSHNLRWGLETRGYGYGDALEPVTAVAPQAKANRVEYRRAGVTEWYENGPLGLEQGFTLAERPGKADGQVLTLELGLTGDFVAELEAGGKGVDLRRVDGEVALRYRGLTARDATGRELRSWLEIRGEQLLVRVEDEAARYPVVVDPWIQQAELTASDGSVNDLLGSSIALSEDGNTIVVGAPHHTVGSNIDQGAAYVFVASGGTWSQQAELTASDGSVNDTFGSSIALSEDGSTIVVGAPFHRVGSNIDQGAAYVFVARGGTWSQQTELIASNGAANDAFGFSVAVSGKTIVVGVPQDVFPRSREAVYVFIARGGTWREQAELTASDGSAAGDLFGISVAVRGGTIVVGAPGRTVGSNITQGAAYVFVRHGGTWSQQAELTASDGAAFDGLGTSVALSEDGSAMVLGAPSKTVGSNIVQGAVYVFSTPRRKGQVKSEGTWTEQAELSAPDGGTIDRFGGSVAISGSTIVVGAIGHAVGSNLEQGAAYVFAASGGMWSQQAELTASDGVAGDSFGSSVALSGSTAVVGAFTHPFVPDGDFGPGAAYVFGLEQDSTTGAN